MAVVSEHLVQLMARQVDDKGLVVWYDLEQAFGPAANLYLEPDLNYGVVLNIAPLWEMVPWKEAKKNWDERLEGKYEWSSIGKQLREKGLVKC